MVANKKRSIPPMAVVILGLAALPLAGIVMVALSGSSAPQPTVKSEAPVATWNETWSEVSVVDPTKPHGMTFSPARKAPCAVLLQVDGHCDGSAVVEVPLGDMGLRLPGEFGQTNMYDWSEGNFDVTYVPTKVTEGEVTVRVKFGYEPNGASTEEDRQ